MTRTETQTTIKEICTVIVPVKNQASAVAFYVDKLGFEKRTDEPMQNGDRWIEVAPPGATTTVALMPPQQGQSSGVESGVIFDTPDADSSLSTLRSRGVDTDPNVTRMGGPVPPMFWFRDQDGNKLCIVERR